MKRVTPTSSRPRSSPSGVWPIVRKFVSSRHLCDAWLPLTRMRSKPSSAPMLPKSVQTKLVLGVTMLSASVIVGCSPNNVTVGDTAVFCQTARDNRELLLNPPLSTPYEVDETIKFYDQMGQLAPLAIADDWNQLVDAMRTANKLVPGNDESEQLVAKTAFASELAAYNVTKWLQSNCGVDLPITTIVPHDPAASLSPDDTTPAIATIATVAPVGPSSLPGDSTPGTGPGASAPTQTTSP